MVKEMKAKPSGKNKASLYVLIDYPEPDDVRFGKLGEGSKSRYLNTFFDSLKFDDYRMGSLVPDLTYSDDKKSTVPPSPLKIYDNLNNVAEDILNSGATTILAVGSTVLKTLLNDQSVSLKGEHNLIKDVKLAGKSLSVVPTYSPTYLLENSNNMDLGSSFYRDLLKVIKMSKGDYVDVLDTLEITVSKTFEEFRSFVDENMQDDTVFTFDYETNAIDVHREGFKPVGFSVANKGNTTDHKLRGTYVVLDSLDYSMTPEDKEKSINYVKSMIINVKDRASRTRGLNYDKYVNSRSDVKTGFTNGRSVDGKVVVHNSLYERPATVNIMNYEIPYDDLDDTLVMAKLLLGGKIGAGLKPQAQAIGFPDWETDLNEYIGKFIQLATSPKKEIYKLAVNNQWGKIYNIKSYSRDYIISFIKDNLSEIIEQINTNFNLSSSQTHLVERTYEVVSSGSVENWDTYYSLLNLVEKLLSTKNVTSRFIKESKYLSTKYSDLVKDQLSGLTQVIIDDLRGHCSLLSQLLDSKYYYDLFVDSIDEQDKIDNRKNHKKDEVSLLESTLGLIDLVLSYYDNQEDFLNVMSMISKKLVEYQDSEYTNIIPYSWVPINLISKYGAMDSVATYKVEDNFLKRMVNESNDEVNLYKGYEVYLRQHFMGYVMEQNGMYWNDDAAHKMKMDMNKNSVNALIKMSKHPEMKIYFKNKFFNEYSPEIIYNNKMLNKYFSDRYHRKVVISGKNDAYKMVSLEPVTNDDGSPKLYENGEQVYSEGKPLAIKYFIQGGNTKTIHLPGIEDIDPKIKEFIEDKVVEKVQKLIDSAKVYEDIKPYFNPKSTQGKDFNALHEAMRKILMTDNYKYGCAIYNIGTADSENAIMKSDRKENSELIDSCVEYLKYRRDYENPDDEEEESYIRSNYYDLKKKNFDRVVELLNKYYVSIGSPTEYDAPRDRKNRIKDTGHLYDIYCRSIFPQIVDPDASNPSVLDISDQGMINMYQYMNQLPIDMEDTSTWKSYPEFEWLYNLRLFKKSTKLITTYIEGTIGRQNVWTVDKKSLMDGNLRLLRKTRYSDLPKDSEDKAIVPEGDSLLLQTRFGVNTADTGRWRSGVHCLVPNTEIALADGRNIKVKDLYNEFKSGKKNYVYSVSHTGEVDDSSEFIIDGIKDVYISGKVNDTAKVTLDNGKSFETTLDHKMVMRDGTYKEAALLMEDDLLYPFSSSEYNDQLDIYNPNQKTWMISGKVDHNTSNFRKVVRVKIVHYDDPVTVYSVSINPDNPSFALSCGVVSKNTIPAGSFIKKMYTSRYKGGSICMPDFCGFGNNVNFLANGEKISTKKLYDDISNGKRPESFYVHSWNTETQSPEIKLAHDLHITKYVKEGYKVTFDNGHSIKVTGNHPLLDRVTQTFIRTDKLKEGQSIQPYNTRINSDGYLEVQKNSSMPNKGWRPIHREVASDLLDHEYRSSDKSSDSYTQVIAHHKDHNKLNNDPSNLIVINQATHMHDHITEYHSDPTNKKKFIEIIKKRDATPEYKNNLRKGIQNEVLRSNYKVLQYYYNNGIAPNRYEWEWMSIQMKRKFGIKKMINFRWITYSDLAGMAKMMGLPESYQARVAYRDYEAQRLFSKYGDKVLKSLIHEIDEIFNKDDHISNELNLPEDEWITGIHYDTIDPKDYLEKLYSYAQKNHLSFNQSTIDSLHISSSIDGYTVEYLLRNDLYYKLAREVIKDPVSTRYLEIDESSKNSYDQLDNIGNALSVLIDEGIDYSSNPLTWNYTLMMHKDRMKSKGVRYRLASKYIVEKYFTSHDEMFDYFGVAHSLRGSYYKGAAQEMKLIQDKGVIPDISNWDSLISNDAYSLRELGKYNYTLSDLAENKEVGLTSEFSAEVLYRQGKVNILSKLYKKNLRNSIRLFRKNYNELLRVQGYVHKSTYVGDSIRSGVLSEGSYNYDNLLSAFSDDDDLRRFMINNHRIVKIEKFYLDEPTPVYDMTVEDNHDFVWMLGELTGIVVHNSQNEIRALASSAKEENMQKSFAAGADIHAENAKLIFSKENISHAERRFAKTASFSILYGASEQSFADSYLDGDLNRAHEIYSNFFKAFPKIKEWRENRFKEVQNTGKVATLTDRFITIKTYDEQSDPYKFAEELRQAGNYPIQGASSDVAGCTMFAIDQNTRKLGLKDKFFVFIHDSLESDCPPFELLKQIKFQQEILANYATDEFGMICKADMELGFSFGHEITLESIDSNDDLDEATLVLNGYKDEIDDTINNWKEVYAVVEVTDTDYKKEYQPTDLFFTPRHALPDIVRKDRFKGTATIHVKYY